VQTYGWGWLEEVLRGHDAQIRKVGQMAVEELQEGDRGRVCDCTQDEHGGGRAGQQRNVLLCEGGAVEMDAPYWAARHDQRRGA